MSAARLVVCPGPKPFVMGLPCVFVIDLLVLLYEASYKSIFSGFVRKYTVCILIVVGAFSRLYTVYSTRLDLQARP